MPTFSFETITAAEALAVRGGDAVQVSSGTAIETTVIYDPNDRVIVTIAGRSVTFAAVFSQVATIPGGQFTYADGSLLFVGDTLGNTVMLPSGATGAAYGGGGDDSFSSSDGRWLVQGNAGGDTIDLRGGNNVAYGGQDGDRIIFGGSDGRASTGGNFGQANKGEDSLAGSTSNDTLLGGQGNDTVDGRGGVDFINGNLGDDRMTGAGLILGEGGNDTLTGGTAGAVTLMGGDDNDRINIVSATEGGVRVAVGVFASGDAGDDVLESTGPLNDTLMGGAGNDVIIGAGNDPGRGDVMDGGDGDDALSARGGANLLRGGAGNDSLQGDTGGDTIDGGPGEDRMEGGAGADLFILRDGLAGPALTSIFADRIIDWSSADHISLRVAGAPGYVETSDPDYQAAVVEAQDLISRGAVEVVAVQVGGDVLLFADGSAANTIFTATILVGRTLADISADNFI